VFPTKAWKNALKAHLNAPVVMPEIKVLRKTRKITIRGRELMKHAAMI
jgi:hypothetical protein